MHNLLVPGKANMIIDGQFGSTGKGLLAAYVAENDHIDITATRLSPNAGHTFYYQGSKYVTKQFPVSGIIQERSTIYIGFGSVIDLEIFEKEIKEFDIDLNRICIHPRAAIITPEDKEIERASELNSISSTLSGTGYARSTKIMRTNKLAQGTDQLRPFIDTANTMKFFLDQELTVLIETSQGFDLSLNVGLSYPYCTSNDLTPSAVLADFGLHPRYLGNVLMSVRTFPIRVGNTQDDNGNEIGFSGPTYIDSLELEFSDLGVDQEVTTVTGKPRRIFTFSKEQYERSLDYLEPDFIFLNFINYLREEDLELFNSIKPPTHVGYGPYTCQVRPWDNYILENSVYKR